MPSPPAKQPPLAEVSTGAAMSPIARMARNDAILMVIARLLRTALLLQAAQVLTSGKPTMDSRRILELAIDLENGKRPCAEYGGGGNERCKYYSHGTLANEMARPCCTHTDSLSIFV
jgi:hypothetical protein